jgi:hypothetical protein
MEDKWPAPPRNPTRFLLAPGAVSRAAIGRGRATIVNLFLLESRLFY